MDRSQSSDHAQTNTFDPAVCMERGHSVARMCFLIDAHCLVFTNLEWLNPRQFACSGLSTIPGLWPTHASEKYVS